MCVLGAVTGKKQTCGKVLYTLQSLEIADGAQKR